jgi:transcriptional regulator with XRE-family HTH domain
MGKPKVRTLDDALRKRGSLTRLAIELGISVTYLCEIRKGRRQPNLALALRLQEVTGVPISSLVQRSERA